jgi:hypothetical protein
MTDLSDRHTSEVNGAIADQRAMEGEFAVNHLNTAKKVKDFKKWWEEVSLDNQDVLSLHKTPKKVMAVGCLALMPHFRVMLDEEKGWNKFSDLLSHIVPLPDSPRWEGRNISTQMYPDQRRMQKDGLIDYVLGENEKPVGVRLTIRGVIYGVSHRTIGMKTLIEWWVTDGKGPKPEDARMPSVLRGGDKPRNRLSVGENVSDEIYYHQTDADQEVLDWFYDNAFQMAQRGVYTATALRNQNPKTRRNAGQITEAIVQGDVKGAFSYLWEEHQELIVHQVIKMAEGDNLTPRTTELVCKSLMQGDVVDNLYAYYSDHIDPEKADMSAIDRDDEISELILRSVWTVVRRIVDYRMNNVRYAPYMKTAIYGPELEQFLHKMALAEDVVFGEIRDPDGQTLSFDIVLDGMPYDLKTLKAKDEISKNRPIF